MDLRSGSKLLAIAIVGSVGLWSIGGAKAVVYSTPMQCFQAGGGESCPTGTMATSTFYTAGELIDGFLVGDGQVVHKMETIADFGQGGPVIFEYGLGDVFGTLLDGPGQQLDALTSPGVVVFQDNSSNANVAGANELGLNSIFES